MNKLMRRLTHFAGGASKFSPKASVVLEYCIIGIGMVISLAVTINAFHTVMA